MKISDHENIQASPGELLKAVLLRDHFHVEGPVKRWFIEKAQIDPLMNFPAGVWLPIFETCLPKLKNDDHLNTLFHLSGYLLKESGPDFVRKNWDKWSPETFRGLTFAAIHCLPIKEAYGLVTDRLDQMDLKERLVCKFILGWFENKQVLKWIEENVQSPIDVSWGTLAARSQFDWEHCEKWLALGRPISLVALDALGLCLTTPRAADGHQYKPLIHPPLENIFKNVLENYMTADPAVRVRRTTEALMSERKRLYA